MHQVLCPICRQYFDRDTKEYTKISARRYAHAECALRQASENGQEPPEIISPLDYVNCAYCGKQIYKKTDSYKKVNTKYFHKECFEQEEKREKTDQEKLNEYIMKLFKTTYVSPRIQKQIKTYIEQYDVTYSGIQRSLEYWIDIKKHKYDTSFDSIGIVPKIYNDAKNYFYAIWEAKQKNEGKQFSAYKPKVIEIKIPPPERNLPKRNLFSFLDEEEEVNGEIC